MSIVRFSHGKQKKTIHAVLSGRRVVGIDLPKKKKNASVRLKPTELFRIHFVTLILYEYGFKFTVR